MIRNMCYYTETKAFYHCDEAREVETRQREREIMKEKDGDK